MGPLSNQSKKHIPFIDGPSLNQLTLSSGLDFSGCQQNEKTHGKDTEILLIETNPQQPPFGCKKPCE